MGIENLPFFSGAEGVDGTACRAVTDDAVNALVVLRLQLENPLRCRGFVLEIDGGGGSGERAQGQESELNKE